MLSGLTVRIGADITALRTALRTASTGVRDFARTNEQAMQTVGMVGAAVTGLGVVAAAGFGAAVKTAMDFESAISRVGALSGASAEQMQLLTAEAERLGATTSFSATQAAEGMQFLAMAGYETNDILAAMPGLLDTAAAGQIDLGRTADIVSNILTGFGIRAEDTGRVADVLTEAFTSSNTTLEMLGQTMKYVAPVAKSSGQSLEGMAAAAGILGNAGIQADQAGTSLRMMLIRLAKPPKMAKDALDQLGISVSDSQGNMKDLSQIIGEMAEATKGMTEADRLAAVAKISGVEASAAMLALMDAGQSTIEDFTKQLENSGGAAQEIATKQLDNLKGQLIILKSAIEGAAISIGNALLPALKLIVAAVTQLVEWFNGLNETTKTIIAVVAALGTVFTLIAGGVLLLIGFLPTLIMGFTALGTVLPAIGSALSTVLGPILLVVAAITAVGTALVLAYNNCEWFREMVNEVWEGIKSIFSAALTFIKDEVVIPIVGAIVDFFSEKLGEIKAFWDENGSTISELVKGHFLVIQTIIQTVMGSIKTIFMTVWPALKAIVQVVWSAIQAVISTVIDVILGIIRTTMRLLEGDWEGAWESIKETAANVWDNIVGIFEDIDLFQIGKDMMQGLIDGISGMARNIGSKVEEIARSIPSGIKEFLQIRSPSRVLKRLGVYAGEGLAIGIDSMKRQVAQSASTLANAAIPAINSSYNTPSMAGAGMMASFNNEPAITTQQFNLERMFDGANITLANGYDTEQFMRDSWRVAQDEKRRRGQR